MGLPSVSSNSSFLPPYLNHNYPYPPRYFPPILKILSDQTSEAARRSELITTALTWFFKFNNLPVDIFPPSLRSVLVLLRTLIPFLGYIGTFIAWSWSSIRSYFFLFLRFVHLSDLDEGYDVTLTATWILPVGLIPGTWYLNYEQK